MAAGGFHVFNAEGGDGTGIIYGAQSDAALQAQTLLADLQAGDVSGLGGDFALNTALDMDYQAFQASDPSVVLELLTAASTAGDLALEGSQWAGALTSVAGGDPAALLTSGLDLDLAAAAMTSGDILGLDSDAALTVFQTAVLGVGSGDDTALQQNISQHADVLDGYLAAISDYDAVDDTAITAIMQQLNLGGQDFELSDTVLQGNDVSGMMASLDLSSLEGLGGQGLLNTTSLLGGADVAGTWGVETALGVLNTVGASSAVSLEALEGIASALGSDGASQLGGDLETIAAGLNYEEDVDLSGFSIGTLSTLDLSATGLLVDDIVGLANTADLGLLSALPETNLTEILNVPLEDLQAIAKDRLPELVGGLGEGLGELLGGSQIDFLLSDQGLNADYLNSGAASFSEIAAAIGGSADTIFEAFANDPNSLGLDDLPEGAADIFADLFG